MKELKRQSGVSLVTAIFLITALAVLAAMATRFLILGSEETINELYSGQALAAAESGVDWAVHDILYAGGSGATVDAPVTTGSSWFTTSVSSLTIGPKTQYTITSTGEAGGSAANPRVQRQIVVVFMP
jgi:Tfp pilus assembly protein PilX